MTLYIYNSSAGSGKTYKIIIEYLCLILLSKKKNYFKNILILTFTNKAAIELKDKIYKFLYNLIYFPECYKSKIFLENLNKNVHINNIQNIILKLKKLLYDILYNYDCLHIYTIDNFSYRIIKSFNLNSSLLVELRDDNYIYYEEIIKYFINNLTISDINSHLIIDFIIDRINNYKSFNIHIDLLNFLLLLNEKNILFLNNDDKYNINDIILLKQNINTRLYYFKDYLRHQANIFLNKMSSTGINVNVFYRSLLPNFFKKFLTQDIFEYNFKNPFNKSLIKSIDNNIIYSRIINDKTQIMNDFLKFSVDKYHTIYDFYHKNISKYILLSLIKKNLSFIGLLNKFYLLINKFKKLDNIMFISDFNYIISRFITSQYITSAYSINYKHCFIDEFQDTSSLQWNNIINFFKNYSSNIKNNIYIFGDIKQSLYRWRNANPDEFIDIIYDKFNSLNKKFNLIVNYRSFSKIIDFNNNLFYYISKYFLNDKYKKLYLDSIFQKKYKNCACGYVEINYLDSKKDYLNNLFIKLTNVINKLLLQGYIYQDIVFLVRKNKESSILIKLFENSQINLFSRDSLLLKNCWIIKCIIYTLSLIVYPNNKSLRIKLLVLLIKYKKIYISQNELDGFFHQCVKKSIYHFFNNFKKFNILLDYHTMYTMPIYDIVKLIITSFKFYSIKYITIVESFLDFIVTYTKKINYSLVLFLDYWNKKKENTTYSNINKINVINIFTIHKSKGLEFPIVIIPFSDWSFRGNNVDQGVWVKEQDVNSNLKYFYLNYNKCMYNINHKYSKIYNKYLDILLFDNLNLLYVATTRAVEKLYLFININKIRINNISFYIDFFLKQSNILYYTNNKYVLGYNIKCYHYPRNIMLTENNTYLNHFVSQNIETSKFLSKNFNFYVKQNHVLDKEMFHKIISNIYYYTDFKKIMNTLLIKRILSYQHYLIILKKIYSIIINKILFKFFTLSSISFCEREINFKGQIFRPDRVTFLMNKTYIIEYKTGLYSLNHVYQLNNYMNILKNMGYQHITSFLVYVNNNIKIFIYSIK
jgi:ATP-dependent exoDNAse (exonuclease V) beta subunit